MFIISYQKYCLDFKFKAKTSRASLTHHNCYIIQICKHDNPNVIGLGEASPLSGLSIDASPDFEKILDKYCHFLCDKKLSISTLYQFIPENLPSIRFAFEMALLDLEQGGRQVLFANMQLPAQRAIPINGLIWMGNLDFMQHQIDEKLSQGYDCLKFKVGALNFNQEYQFIKYLRESYPIQKLMIRLDANGAYRTNDALGILDKWAKLDIHSIEQPIAVGQVEQMGLLCKSSPIPIALDEELIGVSGTSREELLEKISPDYIILKPTLLGGFKASEQWIKLAESFSINWWLTSALESNIALNALAQFVAQYHPSLHQGLGTGGLYINNLPAKTEIKLGQLFLT